MKRKKRQLLIRTVVLAATTTVLFCAYMGYGPFDRSGWGRAEDGSVCYLDRRGDLLTGWQIIDENSYYFLPESGTMATGWLELEEGRYYLSKDGLKSIGWQDLDGGRYFFDDDGRMTTGWLETTDGKYYLTEDGIAYTGWLEDSQGKYYLQNGSPYSGWLEWEKNKYFLDVDGRCHTGWLELEGERFWFYEDGTMAVGKVMIDGVARYFASTGKQFELVNRWNPVPDDYTVTLAEIEGFQMAEESCVPLSELLAACNDAGNPCKIRSGYRSLNFQTTLFQRKVDRLVAEGYSLEAAEQETSRSIAVPGTSEHQLGLAVDFTCGQGAYDWLAEHSWEYGFIRRYPFGKTAVTGIYYEPWHYRYVGKELAKELYDLNLCVEEYVDMLTAQQN